MALILDAGALIAVERRDRDTLALIKQELIARRAPLTHGGVIGQVWRDGVRQASLARLVPALDVAGLDAAFGQRAGVLLRRSRRTDVIDAGVVLLAQDDDVILTSDPDDLAPLAAAADLHVEIAAV